MLGSPLGTVLPALVLIIGADVCLQIANSRISLTIAKILDVQSENHFLVRASQKMIKHMQNNGGQMPLLLMLFLEEEAKKKC